MWSSWSKVHCQDVGMWWASPGLPATEGSARRHRSGASLMTGLVLPCCFPAAVIQEHEGGIGQTLKDKLPENILCPFWEYGQVVLNQHLKHFLLLGINDCLPVWGSWVLCCRNACVWRCVCWNLAASANRMAHCVVMLEIMVELMKSFRVWYCFYLCRWLTSYTCISPPSSQASRRTCLFF